MSNDLTVRPAGPADAAILVELAELDSAAPLTGDALLAESGGRPLAAVALEDGRVVADPFVRTAPVVEVLRVRAAQLRPAARRSDLRRPSHRMRPRWAGT